MRINGSSSARISPAWTKAGTTGGNGPVNPVEAIGEISPAGTYDSTQQNMAEQGSQQKPQQPRTVVVRGTVVTINSTPTYNEKTGAYEGKLDLRVG